MPWLFAWNNCSLLQRNSCLAAKGGKSGSRSNAPTIQAGPQGDQIMGTSQARTRFKFAYGILTKLSDWWQYVSRSRQLLNRDIPAYQKACSFSLMARDLYYKGYYKHSYDSQYVELTCSLANYGNSLFILITTSMLIHDFPWAACAQIRLAPNWAAQWSDSDRCWLGG